MANEGNLKPFTSDQSREEAAKNGRKGGIASGIAKRKKRDWKAKAKAMLETKIPAGAAAKLKALGIDENDADWNDLVLAALIQKAGKGNVGAIQVLAAITGNDGYLKVKQSEVRLHRDELKEKRREFDMEHAERVRQFDLARADKMKAMEATGVGTDWGAEVDAAFNYDAAREDANGQPDQP